MSEIGETPCSACGGPVRIEERPDGVRRYGDTAHPVIQVRVCDNPRCPLKTDAHRAGDSV